MAKVYCASDWHLAAHNSRTDEILDWLYFVDSEPDVEKLILVGDILNNTEVRLRKKEWKILSKLRSMSDKIKIVFVAGNHDTECGPLAHLIGAEFCDFYIYEKIGFIHGQIWDEYLSKHPILTEIADWIYNTLQSIDKSHTLAKFAKRTSKQFLHNHEKVKAGAIQWAAQNSCYFVISGHTHYSYIEQPTSTKQIGYANCGSWTENGSCSYIEIEDGQISLKYWP